MKSVIAGIEIYASSIAKINVSYNYYTHIYLRKITHGYKVDKYPWDVLSNHL